MPGGANGFNIAEIFFAAIIFFMIVRARDVIALVQSLFTCQAKNSLNASPAFMGTPKRHSRHSSENRESIRGRCFVLFPLGFSFLAWDFIFSLSSCSNYRNVSYLYIVRCAASHPLHLYNHKDLIKPNVYRERWIWASNQFKR